MGAMVLLRCEWALKEESANRIHWKDAATHVLDLELASERPPVLSGTKAS